MCYLAFCRISSTKASPLHMLTSLTSEILSQENCADVRPADTFLKLMRNFSAVMKSTWKVAVLFSDKDAHQVLQGLTCHLKSASQMIESTKAMPWVYRMICAFQINSEYRYLCESIEKALTGGEPLVALATDKMVHTLHLSVHSDNLTYSTAPLFLLLSIVNRIL